MVTWTYLQMSCSQVDTCTGNCFRSEPDKRIGPEAVIHVVPVEYNISPQYYNNATLQTPLLLLLFFGLMTKTSYDNDSGM